MCSRCMETQLEWCHSPASDPSLSTVPCVKLAVQIMHQMYSTAELSI